jgi:hypothetical protein
LTLNVGTKPQFDIALYPVKTNFLPLSGFIAGFLSIPDEIKRKHGERKCTSTGKTLKSEYLLR